MLRGSARLPETRIAEHAQDWKKIKLRPLGSKVRAKHADYNSRITFPSTCVGLRRIIINASTAITSNTAKLVREGHDCGSFHKETQQIVRETRGSIQRNS